MTTHKHRVQTTRTRGYLSTATGAFAAGREDRRAHGAVCHVDTCRCGSTRETNSNGSYDERGTWQEPAVLRG